MAQIKRIVVHCSDSGFGNALLIDKWHRRRGFRMIGYHYVVLNGYADYNQMVSTRRWRFLDGSVECGRNLDGDPYLQDDEVGAHVYGFNRETVGVCLIGRGGRFTPRQLYALRVLLNELRHCFNLAPSAVVGHCELNPAKSCPDLNMEHLRRYLTDYDKITLLLNKYWERLD